MPDNLLTSDAGSALPPPLPETTPPPAAAAPTEPSAPASPAAPTLPVPSSEAPTVEVPVLPPPAPLTAPKSEEEASTEESTEEAEAAAEPAPNNKRWYVVKVQSAREETIKEAIERRMKIEGLEEFFGQIVIPVERVTEMKKARDGSTKRVVREHKLYPGYLMCEVEYNDRILYLFRETPGVGDFVGGTVNRPPPPMPPHEVEKMLRTKPGAPDEKIVPGKALFAVDDHIRVRDSTFAGMEGVVKEVMDAAGKVKVELTIFGRPVSVEFEYWQVEEA